MTRVALGRIGMRGSYDTLHWREYLDLDVESKDEFIFASDAFYEPDYSLLGIASSYHHHHLYPLSQRDVQAAFSILRSVLCARDPTIRTGVDFLRDLLLSVHRGFADINMSKHVAGIEFEVPIGIDLYDPVEDPAAVPMVRMTLARVQDQRLSVAKVGNALVYLVRQSGRELLTGRELLPILHTTEAVLEPLDGSHLVARKPAPQIDVCESEIRLGDLVVVATDTLEEVIAAANLEVFAGTTVQVSPEAISQHLLHTLRSQPGRFDKPGAGPGDWTDRAVMRWGAAWAVACVET